MDGLKNMEYSDREDLAHFLLGNFSGNDTTLADNFIDEMEYWANTLIGRKKVHANS